MAAEYFTLMIITWNLDGQNPPHGLDLKPLLGLPQSKPDAFVIGLQEMNSGFQNFFSKDFSNELLNYEYTLLESKHLLNIGMFIFVKMESQSHFTNVGKGKSPTGFLNVLGNKGATVICLDIFQIYTCFVNSHLKANEENNSKQIESVEKIEKNKLLKEGENATMFWFGDLNFRLENKEMDANAIIREINDGKASYLFDRYDGLTLLKESHAVFRLFKENQVTFPPTYKFKIGTSDYDETKKPAWTDRILYKDIHDIVKQTKYDSFPDLKISDHKPVRAYFSVERNYDLSKEQVAKP